MVRRIRALVRAHPVWSAMAGVVGLGLFAFALVWFGPHKLFIDERVDEELPIAGEPADPEPAAVEEPDQEEAAPPRREVLGRGEFRSLSHEGAGKALLVRLPDGRVFVRFEDLDVQNGPDLRVYLSTAPSDAEESAFDDDFVDLGALKGNIGNQNYPVPDEVNLDRYESVVIWCRRFSSGFAAAPLR